MSPRVAWSGIAVFGVLVLAGTALAGSHPLVVYNPTPSAPPGFYTVSPARALHVGDMVIVAVPPAYRQLVLDRHYIGTGVTLLKRIVALDGDIVCERAGTVTVDGQGRPMPIWAGCRRLGKTEFFAIMDRSPYSLDSRYFGPLPTALIVGKARPLWLF
jgi:conjugative transfer signal peptidase TraF